MNNRFLPFLLSLFLLLSGSALLGQAGKYKYHTVQKGETIYSISRQYGVSVQEILDLNPEIDPDNVQVDETLLLPLKKKDEEGTKQAANTYTVQRGDTWYSIARKFELRIEQLQNANPELRRNRNLRVDDVLKIPAAESTSATEYPTDSVSADGMLYHYVRQGDTWYSLARKYEVKTSRLLEWNPDFSGQLNAGFWVLVKQEAVTIAENQRDSIAQETLASDDPPSVSPSEPAAVINEAETREEDESNSASSAARDTNEEKTAYILHRIERGDQLQSIAATYNTSTEELIRLNPELADGGMQAGRYIIVPSKRSKQTEEEDIASDSLKVEDMGHLQLSILLPFSDFRADTLTVEEMRYARSGRMRLRASSFYAGAKLALDSLSKSGDSLRVKIYDTANRLSRMDSITQDIFLQNSHFTLGPMYGKNAEWLDKRLGSSEKRPKVVSPLSANLEGDGRTALIDLYPQGQEGLNTVLDHLLTRKDTFHWIASGSGSSQERAWFNRLSDSLKGLPHLTNHPYIFVPEEEKGYRVNELKALKPDNVPLVIINLTQDPSLMADIERKAFGLNDSVQLYSIHEWPASLRLEMDYLNGLRLTYPQAFHVDYSKKEVKSFVLRYRQSFDAEPDVFAFQAWDAIFLIHQMWKSEASVYEYQGLQSGYRLEMQNGVWRNLGWRLLQMEDYRWKVLKY